MASKTAKIALATNVMENHFGDKWFRLSKKQVNARCSTLGKVDQSEIRAAIKIIDDFRNSDVDKKYQQGKTGRYEKTDIMIEKNLKTAIANKMTHAEMLEMIPCSEATYWKHLKNNGRLKKLGKCLPRSSRFVELVVMQEDGQLAFYPNAVAASRALNVSGYAIRKALNTKDGCGAINGNRIKLKSLWEKEGFLND